MFDGAVVLQQGWGIGAAHQQRRDRHAPRRNLLHHLQLADRRNSARPPPAMRQKPQYAAGRNAGILLAERPGGGIARVGKQFSAHFMLRSIKCGKILFSHVNFAANFEDGGHCAAQHLRNIGNMRDIGGNILTHLAITPRRRAHQHAVLITQRARQPVDLVLRRHRYRGIIRQRQKPPHPRDELRHVFIGKSIVEAHHARLVAHLAERRCGNFVADHPAGRIRPDQLRIGRLQFIIPPHQSVIVGIGNLRRIVGVIELVVPRDLARKPHQLIGGFGFAAIAHGALVSGAARVRKLRRARALQLPR